MILSAIIFYYEGGHTDVWGMGKHFGVWGYPFYEFESRKQQIAPGPSISHYL